MVYLIAQREKKINNKFEKKIKKPHNGNRTNIRNLFFCKRKENTTSSKHLLCTLFVAIMVHPPVMINDCRDPVYAASQWGWVSLPRRYVTFDRLAFPLVFMVSASARAFFGKKESTRATRAGGRFANVLHWWLVPDPRQISPKLISNFSTGGEMRGWSQAIDHWNVWTEGLVIAFILSFCGSFYYFLHIWCIYIYIYITYRVKSFSLHTF